MTAGFGLPCLLLAGSLSACAWSQDRCHVAQDLVVQARERLGGHPTPANTGDGLQLLKQANLACPSLGDGWYYRSLFERELKHGPLADFALNQAKINGSEAMQNGANPFQLAAPPSAAPLGPVRQKWALIIGINEFPQCNNVKKLKFAENDADELASVLRSPQVGNFPENNLVLLTGHSSLKPTRANIKAAMNRIARSADPSDLVLIFIASHGTPHSIDSVGGLNYILTTDTDTKGNPNLKEVEKNMTEDDRLWSTALPMVEISDDVRTRIKAVRTVILLDTCHSQGVAGSKRRDATLSKENIDGLVAGTGRVIISSSAQEEKSYEIDNLEHGAFAGVLIDALKQNPKAPISKLFDVLQQQVPSLVQTAAHSPQHPVMVQSAQGVDIVLGGGPVNPVAWLRIRSGDSGRFSWLR